MTRQVSACLPSWARPRPMRRRFSSSTRTSRRRRCAANSRLLKRPSRARTKVGGATGCETNGLCCNCWGCARVGFFTDCPATSSRRIGGLGRIWRPLVYGTSTRSDCRKALLFDGGTMRRPHFSNPKKHFAGFFSLLFLFLGPDSLPYPTLFIRRRIHRPAYPTSSDDTITWSLFKESRLAREGQVQ